MGTKSVMVSIFSHNSHMEPPLMYLFAAFQTVVALAEYQAAEEKSTEIEIKIDYLDQVVKMSKRFKKYLSEMPDGDVAKKAWRWIPILANGIIVHLKSIVCKVGGVMIGQQE